MSDENKNSQPKLMYGDIEIFLREDEPQDDDEITLFGLGHCVISLVLDQDEDDHTWKVLDTKSAWIDYVSSLREALDNAVQSLEDDDDEDEGAGE